MCGKSAHYTSVMKYRGKPHLEQDKIGTSGDSFRLIVRVCRIDKWLLKSFLLLQNPAYRFMTNFF